MSMFTVIPLINTADGNFFGYDPDHARTLATDGALRLQVKASDDAQALEEAFSIGNRMGCDIHGKEWPSHVRSLSVGDAAVVRRDGETGTGRAYACADLGWKRREDLDHVWTDCMALDRMVMAGHARNPEVVP